MRGWALKRSWTAFDQEALTFGELDYRCECYIETDEGLLVPRAYESFSNPDESITLGGELSDLAPISLSL